MAGHLLSESIAGPWRAEVPPVWPRPGRIGSLQLPHRILMGAMHLGIESQPDGEALAAFYAERAHGGAALIITGGSAAFPIRDFLTRANVAFVYRDDEGPAGGIAADAVADRAEAAGPDSAADAPGSVSPGSVSPGAISPGRASGEAGGPPGLPRRVPGSGLSGGKANASHHHRDLTADAT